MNTLVLGIGNLLMGDEAVGVHVAREVASLLDRPKSEVRSPKSLTPDSGLPPSRAVDSPRFGGTGQAPDVTVVDGGTGGFHLLSCLTDFDPVIVVDATMDGKPAGTVSVTQPRYATDFPRSLTAHDIGLRDLVESAALVGDLPTMFLVTISVDSIQPMEDRLSPAVAAAVPRAVTEVTHLLDPRNK